MNRRAARTLLLAAAGLLLAVPAARAAAPSGKEYMQPVDTAAGSISDPKKLLKVDLDRSAKVSVSEMPLEVAFNQLNACSASSSATARESPLRSP
jgi:hypothetical protein